MRHVKPFCLCSCILGVLATSALGQNVRMYMLEDSVGPPVPAPGDTSMFMDPGQTKTIGVFLADGDNNQLLNAYQVLVRAIAFPLGTCNGTVNPAAMGDPCGVGNPDACGANVQVPGVSVPGADADCVGGATTGTVTYLDDGAPPGSGGSVAIDQTRADYVFLGAFPNPPTFGETDTFPPLDVGGWGSIVQTPPSASPSLQNVSNYIMSADLVASADACGQFILEIIPGPAGVPQGGSFLTIEDQSSFFVVDTYNALVITIGPQNDACVDASTANDGNNAFDTRCADTDGPADASGIDGDVWFAYDATCTGDLTITTSGYTGTGTAQVGVYPAGCPASGLLANGAGVPALAVSANESLLIRVGSDTVGDTGQGSISISCAASCTPGASQAQLTTECVDNAGLVDGVDVDLQCTSISCDIAGCHFNAEPTNSCTDADICTLTDSCSGGPLDAAVGGASCVGSNVNSCDDFNGCTLDSCDQATGDPTTGCINDDVNDNTCTSDAECGDGTCNLVSGLCECAACPNQTGSNEVCLEIRNAANTVNGGPCGSDADCTGGQICVDNNDDPNDPGICVDQVCYALGDKINIDIELGNLLGDDIACGAQLALAWDASSLEFKSITYDPDDGLGWTQVLIQQIDPVAGTLNFAIGTPPGVACDPAHGVKCGTIARLSFTAIADCKSGGVWFDCLNPDIPGDFSTCNPQNAISGPNGAVPITGCGGADLAFSGIGAGTINVNNDPPVFSCPDEFDGNADCNSVLATIDLGDPVSVSDPCVGASIPGTTPGLCTTAFFTACDNALDCGVGALCNMADPCNCIADTTANELGFDGFCALDTCTDGTCDTASSLDVSFLLDGGVVQLSPGLGTIHCSYTNDCGVTSTCDRSFRNSGMNLLCVDVEMSPSMVAGDPNTPITRCIDFELTLCDAAGDPVSVAVSTEVVFGAPNNIPGHGSVCFKVPPNNWTCLTAKDPKHSLTATCFVECVDNVFHAQFKGSPTTNPLCHWLIQGNLNDDPHIDIVDYTILAGQYLDFVGDDTLCKGPNPPADNFHADLNGDGYVTISDFTFVVFNFFEVSKDPCDVICNPGLAAPKQQPRSEISVRELTRMGLGDYARAADVNSDGTVNLADMASFLELNSEGDDALTVQLIDAVDSRISNSAGLR